MIYEPREITCRDGRSCILRSAAVTDANDLIRYLKVTAGLSQSHFMKYFKNTMGTSFIEYLNEYRLTMASRLLISTVYGKAGDL